MPRGIYKRPLGYIPKMAFKKGYVPKRESVEKMRTTKKNTPWTEARRKAQLNVKCSPWSEERKRKPKKPRKPLIKNGKEYPFNWNEIRKEVYKRDGWVCQECGIHCHNRKQIQCHHIDYDTSNNALSNLITLCSSCHAKTNFNREDWIKYYTDRKVKTDDKTRTS